MWYGVVAPGIHTVYDNYQAVERILALYPYPKFRKFYKEDLAWEFVNRYENKHYFTSITNYGDTFKSLYVTMEYFIDKDRICYNFRTDKIGYIKILSDDAIVENRNNLIMAELPNIFLNKNRIHSHLIAIFYGLNLIGDYIDINVIVPDHSIFYTLATYKGEDKAILKVKKKIDERLGKLSVSLPDLGEEEYYGEELCDE